MKTTRLEAFSDGVLAIIITIMVLELKVPDGADAESLKPLIPHVVSYVISFVYLGIYWNNHHHMLHTVERTTGGILWANLHLMFWLSLLPAATDRETNSSHRRLMSGELPPWGLAPRLRGPSLAGSWSLERNS